MFSFELWLFFLLHWQIFFPFQSKTNTFFFFFFRKDLQYYFKSFCILIQEWSDISTSKTNTTKTQSKTILLCSDPFMWMTIFVYFLHTKNANLLVEKVSDLIQLCADSSHFTVVNFALLLFLSLWISGLNLILGL